MDNGNYISFEDFQKYTENLSEIIADLQSAIANYKTELDSVKKEKEGIKPTEAFEDGKTDNSAISALVADNIDMKVAEVEEKYENLKKYTMYLAEQLDNSISHQDYIVEEVNKIGGNLVEETKTEETKTEETSVNEETKVEETPVNEETKVEETVETPVNENNETEETKVEETPVEEEKFDAKAYQTALTEKLDAILAAAKAQYEEAKRLEAEAIEESKKNAESKNFALINYIPARLSEKWSKLSDERKQEILAEAKMFVINNQASAEYFWSTRDFRDKQVELQKVDEAKVAQPKPVADNSIPEERLQAMKEQIQRRMRRW